MVLAKQRVGYDRIAVPGALEIPQVFAQAAAKGLFGPGKGAKYRGAIIAGCVIRGETSHYDIVCNSTNHWVMETAIRNTIPLGNALLTVDTKEQAFARARGGEAGKGGDAARALSSSDLDRHAIREPSSMSQTKKKKQDAGGSGGPMPRTIARMAAVQALYQMDLAGADAATVIDEFVKLRFSPPLPDADGVLPEEDPRTRTISTALTRRTSPTS